MASIKSLLEDYRNWIKTQEWKNKKQDERLFGGDPVLQEEFEKWSGGFSPSNIGAGLSGMAGAIKAYHGSPFAFTKFLMSKLGTGEGAQAYGHGLYFAEHPETAIQYKNTLTNFRPDHIERSLIERGVHPDLANAYAAFAAKTSGGNRAIDDFEKTISEKSASPYIEGFRQKLRENLPKLKAEQDAINGSLYNVELRWPDAAKEAADPLGEHHLLDWDIPMTQQTPALQKAWLATKKELPPNAMDDLGGDLSLLYGKNVTPEDFLGTLASIGGHPGFGESLLRKAGVPGLRYLDQASRGAGEGTRNYVMFDDRFPNIVSRNGVSLVDLLRK